MRDGRKWTLQSNDNRKETRKRCENYLKAFAKRISNPPAVKNIKIPHCQQWSKYGTVSIDINAERRLRLEVVVLHLRLVAHVSIDINAERRLRPRELGDGRAEIVVSIDINAERRLRLERHRVKAAGPELVSIDINAERRLRQQVSDQDSSVFSILYQPTSRPKGD